jgi:small Trp-rich protein
MRYIGRWRSAMPLVVVGVLLMLAKWAEFGPFASWSWWIVLAPFAGAVLWWEFADNSGWTKSKAMEKMEQRKVDRREKAMEALGISKRRDKVISRAQRAKAQEISADVTHAGRDAPSKPRESADPTRRNEPRL